MHAGCLFIRRELFHLRKSLVRLHSTSKLCITDIRSELNKFEGGEVTLSHTGGEKQLAVISASNPDKKNAFTGSMCVSLYDKIQQLANCDTSKAVILRGLNGMFCSGADLDMAKQIADPENGEKFSLFMQTTLSNLRSLPLPSFALIQGNVLGGGAELMVACDFVIAHPNTKIYFIQGRMGIVPGWGGATHLHSKVGYHKALDILLSGRGINSDYAQSIGLIDNILNSSDNLSDDFLLENAVKIIEHQLGHLPLDVIRGLKSVTLSASRLRYEDSITNERQVFKSLWGGTANMAALKANLKHR